MGEQRVETRSRTIGPPTDWRKEARDRIAEKTFVRFDDTRHSVFKWLAFEDEFEFLVTVQFGVPLQERPVISALKRLGALLDRYWLGRAWSKIESGDRTHFVATIERGHNGNYHAHLLLRRPAKVIIASRDAGWREESQERVLTKVFTALGREKRICSRGDIRFDRLRQEDDQVRAAGYILKEFGSGNSTELILATEFHPQ